MEKINNIKTVLQGQVSFYRSNFKSWNDQYDKVEPIKQSLQQVRSLEEFIGLDLEKTNDDGIRTSLPSVFLDRFIELFKQNPITDYKELMDIHSTLLNYECRQYILLPLIKVLLTELGTLTWEERVKIYNFIGTKKIWPYGREFEHQWSKLLSSLAELIKNLEDRETLVEIIEFCPGDFTNWSCLPMNCRTYFMNEISLRIVALSTRNTLEQNVDFIRKITKNELVMKNLGEWKHALLGGIEKQIVVGFGEIIVKRSVSFENLYSYFQEILVILKIDKPNELDEKFYWDHHDSLKRITEKVTKLFDAPLLKFTYLIFYKVDFKILFDMYQIMRRHNLSLYHVVGKQLLILSKIKENEEQLNKLSSKYLFKIEFDEKKVSKEMLVTN